MDDPCDSSDEGPATVPTGPDARTRVVAAAVGELGEKDATPYWKSALDSVVLPAGVHELAWCGAFALWCLHQAELAQSMRWEFGRGFLYHLTITHDPLPGDVAYFSREQHHAIVERTELDAGIVHLINGNGLGGAVTRSMGPRGLPTAYYSIAGLISAEGLSA